MSERKHSVNRPQSWCDCEHRLSYPSNQETALSTIYPANQQD